MGQVLSRERKGSRWRCSYVMQKPISLRAQMAMRGVDLAWSETLCTWRRPLYGTWEISSVPGQACRDGS
jgi:hypothetical protein